MNGSGDPMMFDRIPPQNLEAEQAVLGAILLESEALITAMEKLRADDFYSVSHQRIYDVMVALNDDSEPIDLVTLTARLQDLGQMDEIGGVSYLAKLANSVPTAANVEYYAQIVEEKAILRRLIRTATQIVCC
jgi:replicative DNA helicase